MRKLFAISAASLGALLTQPTVWSAEAPDGVIELAGGSAAAGVGITWGSGILIFQGKRYSLVVDGGQIAAVGVREYTAAGSVEEFRTPQGIERIYSVGLNLGGGDSITARQNQNAR
jgi:hypothetical protein